MSQTDRREFLIRLSALMAATLTPLSLASCKTPETDKWGELLPLRALGTTGDRITMLGVGGWHFGDMPESECPKVVEAAIESGIRLFDSAEGYQKGGSEERYGKYLVPKYRDEVFLFTKTTASDAKKARQHLERSLRRMKTDYVDLWKMHSVASPEDVDNRLGNGVLEEMLKAKEEGKVRHIGFSVHGNHQAANHLLKMQDQYKTCQLPVNVADPSYESFFLNTIPELQEQEYAIMAMKTLAGGGLLGASGESSKPVPDRQRVIPEMLSVEKALHYAWSLPVSTIISGMRNVDELNKNVSAARTFQAMNLEERKALIASVAETASTGEMEWYKRPL